MNKEDVTYMRTHTHTHRNYTQPKKNEILPFVTKWMDLKVIMLSEIIR